MVGGFQLTAIDKSYNLLILKIMVQTHNRTFIVSKPDNIQS